MKYVPILGHNFKLELVPKMQDLGECDGVSKTIKISKDHKSVDALVSTLLHEIIHGALYISGHSEKLEKEQEEGIVLALEHAIYPIIPRLIIYRDRLKKLNPKK